MKDVKLGDQVVHKSGFRGEVVRVARSGGALHTVPTKMLGGVQPRTAVDASVTRVTVAPAMGEPKEFKAEELELAEAPPAA